MVPPAPVTNTRFPRNQRLQGFAIGYRLRAPQKILDRDRLGFEAISENIPEIGGLGQPRKLDPERVGGVEQFPHQRAIQHVLCDDHALWPGAAFCQLTDHLRNIVERAEDMHSMNGATDPSTLFIHQTDHPIGRIAAPIDRPDERLRGIARAREEDWNSTALIALGGQIEPPVFEDAVNETRPAQQAHKNEPVDDQNRSRQRLQPGHQEHDWQKNEDRHRNRLGDGGQIIERGVAPHPGIEPHRPKRDRTD